MGNSINNIVKKIVKYILFCTLGAGIFVCIQNVFLPKYEDDTVMSNYDRDYRELYELEKESIDVLAIGNSTFLSGIDPMYIWGECGIPVFNRSTAGMPLALMEYFLYDALEFHSPKVVILNAQGLDKNWNAVLGQEGLEMRNKAIESMPWGKAKLQAVKKMEDLYLNVDAISYFFPLLTYHSRWKDITASDFQNYERSQQDYYLKGYTAVFDIYEGADWDLEEISPNGIKEENLAYYDRMIKYCKDKDIEVVLLAMPNSLMSLNKIQQLTEYAEKMGVTFWDFNQIYYETGFSAKICYTDMGRHLNYWGSSIVSKYLGKWLVEQYGLENKKTYVEYRKWNEDYQRYSTLIEREVKSVELSKTDDINECIEIIQSTEDYIVTLILSNGYMGESIHKVENILNLFQGSKNPVENGQYIAVYDENELVYEESQESKFSVTQFGDTVDGFNVHVASTGRMANSKSSVIINNHSAAQTDGFHLVVYDKILDRFVCDRIIE